MKASIFSRWLPHWAEKLLSVIKGEEIKMAVEYGIRLQGPTLDVSVITAEAIDVSVITAGSCEEAKAFHQEGVNTDESTGV